MAYYTYEKKTTATKRSYSRLLIVGLFAIAAIVFSVGLYLSLQDTPMIISSHTPSAKK